MNIQKSGTQCFITNLDNTIVYRGLVKNLQKLKGRQSVFATYNADILVLGYADRNSFEFSEKRQNMLQRMEGGKKASREGGDVLWIY